MTKLEKDLEARCIKHVENLGGKCLKVKAEGQRGFPDRLIILDRFMGLVEFKRPDGKGKVSRHQERFIDFLTAKRVPCLITDSYEEFAEWLHVYSKIKTP